MRNKILSGLAVAGIALGAGVATTGSANAANAGSWCANLYTTLEPTLHANDTGTAVKALQCELNGSVRNVSLAQDGVFGQATLAAVYKFQSCAGLSSDGVVGPQTWSKLDHWSNSSGYVC